MKTKSKLLVSFLCLLLVVFCLSALSSCGKCDHKWSSWKKVSEPTCTEDGSLERTCSKCGETETTEIDKLGHSWIAATCSNPKTCENCQTTEGTKLPHSYTLSNANDATLKSAATCDSPAVYYKSCVCGAISKNDKDTFTAGAPLSHADSNKDHVCDSGCSVTFGDHADGDDEDHLCDYGCGMIADEGCYDTVVDGKCDECGADVDHTCVDSDKNHACDICSVPMGEHCDSDLDHVCDYGCRETFGVCSDADFNHVCDYGCDRFLGACEDTNLDHECDHGCDKTFGDHSDSAEDGDHNCDYGCGATIESCSDVDGDGDHNCDVCNMADVSGHDYSEATCASPATCLECGATTGSTVDHVDADLNHVCDNGCGKNDIGEHRDSDTDGDHLCDYGCNVALESCFDSETDGDHSCDVCGAENVTAHAYVENVALATAANCSTAATKTYECNCGDTYTENDGDALGHNTTGSTATERHVGGCEYVLVYVCQRGDCGEEVLGETVYRHNYVASIDAYATCIEDGRKVFVCSDCGDTSKAPEIIPADETGHNWITGEVVNGVRIDSCSVCSAEKTVTVYTGTTTDEINAGDLANTEIELNNANISLDSGVIDTIGDQNVTVSADKLEGDDRADLGLSDDQLAQVGDSPIYNFTINNGRENISNFGEDNYVTITLPYTLSDGEDVDSIAVWFINDFGELESIKATYNNGYVTFKTNHFSYYTVTRLTPAERCALYGHGYARQHVEGSCTADSYDLYVCVRCHDRYIDEASRVVADGHDYSVETHAATCTQDGYILYDCVDCTHGYRTKLSATGHDWVLVESGDISCTADGFERYECNNANCPEGRYIILPKPGHSYVDTVVEATCSADGYTVHTCENCNYSYTDSYVEALGHSYVAGEWKWEANGNKATLTLVCEHDDSHVTALRVISTMQKEVEKGACSNYVIRTHTATVEYNGVTYTDVMVIRQGNPTHIFTDEWTADEDEHWHQCICGATTDVAPHTFGEATVTLEPGCNTPGEKISYCSVCGEAKVTEIPATGDHNYVDGVCSVCGERNTGCDHTRLHREIIDLGDYGACLGILAYYTCECGEVKNFDIELVSIYGMNCSFDSGRNNEYVDENGNECEVAVMVCSACGLELTITTVTGRDGCTMFMDGIINVKIGDTVIIDSTVHIAREEDHENLTEETVNLADYGYCGGTMTFDKCLDCGKLVQPVDTDILCDIDLESDPGTEEIVDENGNVHYVQRVVCSDCGLEVYVDQWIEIYYTCETISHVDVYIRGGDHVIYELHYNSERQIDHNMEQSSFEPLGESCDDVFKVWYTCSECGYSVYLYESGHRWEYSSTDLGELGLCGGEIRERHCLVCDETVIEYINDYSCNWSFVETNSDGHDVYVCNWCGAMRHRYVYESEKDENCRYERTGITIYLVNGEEVARYNSTSYYTGHLYEYEFTLNGASCIDGYTVLATCRDCGYSYTETGSSHSTYTFFHSDNYVTGYNVCDDHDLFVQGCPCGQSLYADCNTSSFQYDGDSNTYVCDDCGLFISANSTEYELGCEYIKTYNIEVYLNGDALYVLNKEVSYANHSFVGFEASMINGVTYITASCEKCDAEISSEILSVEMEQHGNEYYCDYIFTPSESAVYTIQGLSDRDTYVVLYQQVNGDLVRINYNDDGRGNQFYLTASLTAGATYVYRISFYGQDEEGSISFVLNQGASESAICNHNYSSGFSVLPEGSDSCEDGVLYGEACRACGCLNDVYVTYDHMTSLKETVDLSEFGACYGSINIYSCACGQNESMSTGNMCWDTSSSNEYYDDAGRLIHVTVRTCYGCDLRFTESYYTVKNRENCTMTYYVTVVINVGANLVYETEYITVEESHDYEITATLMNGEGSSCNDGVTFTYKCRDCDYEYTWSAYYHSTYDKEYIDLSSLGSVCGGYATVTGCACGYYNSVSLEHSLCELGSESCTLWIEDAITESGQYQVGGWVSYGYDARLYICAVTDPADAACAYKIKYASYYKNEPNSCIAYRYETYLFGYNEETSEYEYELTFKNGGSTAHHNYVTETEGNSTRYYCPDCGSYYYNNYYYYDNGYTEKREIVALNTLDNGQYKYSEEVYEYAFDVDGNHYTCREYEKVIYSDDSVYWYEIITLQEPYEGPFGDYGYKKYESTSNSNGRSYVNEYAYVYYKGYSFNIYDYRQEDGSWYRYDYTYSFDNGCVRTTVYTDSNGERTEVSSNICRFYSYETIEYPTCSQDGLIRYYCIICDKHGATEIVEANDHGWVKITDNWYYCFTCGLENANGVSGDIILEDLTEQYGNGEYYVAGYYARNNVEFTQYVSLILPDGEEVPIWSGIDIITIDGIRAYAFSKSAVEAWASENGYTDYDIRLSFVPVGSDGSFDYGLTFAEATVEVGDVIIDSVSFVDYIGQGETKVYTITPTEDSVWTFTTRANGDTYGYLYDADGNRLTYDDDNGQGNNFYFSYELKAGETYTVRIRWYYSDNAGAVPVIFVCEPKN